MPDQVIDVPASSTPAAPAPDSLPADATPQEFLAEIGGWPALLPDDFTIEHGGKQVPVKELDIVKSTKDVQSLVKQLVDSQSEIGRRVRIPGKDAKPEDVRAFRSKLYESGLLEAPPEKPESYQINKPEKLADGLTWNDELEGKFKTVAHSMGLTQKQAQGLVDFYNESMGNMAEAVHLSIEEGTKALKEKWGPEYDAKAELAGRAGKAIFKDQPTMQFFEKIGAFNHPGFIEMMAEIGSRIQEDQTILPSFDNVAVDEEYNAALTLMQELMNGTFKGNRVEAEAKIKAAFEKKFGTAPATQPVGQVKELKVS